MGWRGMNPKEPQVTHGQDRHVRFFAIFCIFSGRCQSGFESV